MNARIDERFDACELLSCPLFDLCIIVALLLRYGTIPWYWQKYQTRSPSLTMVDLRYEKSIRGGGNKRKIKCLYRLFTYLRRHFGPATALPGINVLHAMSSIMTPTSDHSRLIESGMTRCRRERPY